MPATSQPRALYLEPSEPSPQGTVGAAEARLGMDEASFRLFYERSAPRLFTYLLRVSGERALAEDLLQESYCRFLSSKRPEMDEASQQSYLLRITSNLMRDRWRRHRESQMPEKLPELATNLPQLDRQLALRQAFQQLKVRERKLLWLAYVEGSNHKEIAQATGLRPASVRPLLFRARRKLANLLRGSASLQRERSK